jgi:hypothetical protein
MRVGCGKFYWCGHGLGRAEQHCKLVQCVLLIFFWNRTIFFCFLPVYLQKLLWLRPSWTTLNTHCIHVKQVQLMRLSSTPPYNCALHGARLASVVSQRLYTNLHIWLHLLTVISCSSKSKCCGGFAHRSSYKVRSGLKRIWGKKNFPVYLSLMI